MHPLVAPSDNISKNFEYIIDLALIIISNFFQIFNQSSLFIPTQKNDKKMTELGNKYQGYFALFFTDLAVVKKT